MMKRVGIQPEISLVGGGAKNIAIKTILQETLSEKIFVPPNPQIIGALGCAFY